MRFLVFLSFFSLSSFSLDNECVRANFDISIEREGAFWGMLPYKLKVSKDRCVIKLVRDNVLKSNWELDLCREPVHLKVYQYFTKKDFLKEEACHDKTKNTFCRKKDEFIKVIEKEGLVHVKGEREDFSSDHGKLYCLYGLVKDYLNNSILFSMTQDYESLHGQAQILEEVEMKQGLPKAKPAEVINQEKAQDWVEGKGKAKEIKEDVQENIKEKIQVIKKAVTKKLEEF